MTETAAKIDSDATDDEVIAQAEDELRKLAMPIKEACMPPQSREVSIATSQCCWI